VHCELVAGPVACGSESAGGQVPRVNGWLQGALFVAGGIVTVNAALGVVTAITDRTIARRRRAYAQLRQPAAHVHVDFSHLRTVPFG
jgi:hypothetical protein